MARVAMLAMHRDGLIALPACRRRRQNRPTADRLRAGHAKRRCSRPRRPSNEDRARPAPRRARHPPEQALERVRRPLPLSRIQDPGRRPDALRRPRPRRLAARHARASPPPRGSSPRATTSSDGHGNCARRTFPSWSTTRAPDPAGSIPGRTWVTAHPGHHSRSALKGAR